ncbi:hypothetical protein, partial [Chryseobacterium sp. SIMBA_028]|uniref:hypothetical protein n=1 Tax=Chryseobacterium sp. SIMBA_028 TaxID=3085771 RepID=UPI00397AE2EC
FQLTDRPQRELDDILLEKRLADAGNLLVEVVLALLKTCHTLQKNVDLVLRGADGFSHAVTRVVHAGQSIFRHLDGLLGVEFTGLVLGLAGKKVHALAL